MPNHKPHLFIGSSVKSLAVAGEMQSIMGGDRFVVKVWTDGVFRASITTVQDLMVQVKQADFAIVVSSPPRRGGGRSPGPWQFCRSWRCQDVERLLLLQEDLGSRSFAWPCDDDGPILEVVKRPIAHCRPFLGAGMGPAAPKSG
jgi:hypothetical protein